MSETIAQDRVRTAAPKSIATPAAPSSVVRAKPGATRNSAGNVLSGATVSELVKAAAVAITIAVIASSHGGWVIYRDWRDKENAKLAAADAAKAHARLVAAPALATLAVEEAARGRDIFLNACVTCHGSDARGLPGLGKNLAESPFVAAQDDTQLFNFLVTGRPDAKPLPMLPRGGRADLTDDDLRHLVVYLRGVQDPRRMPALPAVATISAAAPTQAEKDKALAAAGGDAELAGYIASGTKLYNSTCIACHGPSGAGIAGNGKTLANNVFIQSLKDDDLLAFVKQGRAPSDPKNTTGVQMPPKGGNPAMSDDDILDVISYLRTLQPAGAAKGK